MPTKLTQVQHDVLRALYEGKRVAHVAGTDKLNLVEFDTTAKAWVLTPSGLSVILDHLEYAP